MRNVRRILVGLVLVASVQLAFAAEDPAPVADLPDVPPRGPSGQQLVVPERELDLGMVYHLETGKDAQLLARLEADLARTVLTCRRAVGYFVVPFDLDDEAEPIVSGALRIPVASLRTGFDQIDALLHAETMLDVAHYPEILYRLESVRGVEDITTDEGPREYRLKLLGALVIKDRPFPLEVEAEVRLLPFTWQTMSRNVGDLLRIKTSFEFSLADFGLSLPSPRYAGIFPASFDVDLYLVACTVPPNKTLDPAVPAEQHIRQLGFLTHLRDFDDPEKAYEMGREFAFSLREDAAALARLVRAVLTEPGIETRDLLFAWKLAQRALVLQGEGDADPDLLLLLAEVCDRRGDPAAAAVHAEAALAACEEGGPQHSAIQQQLDDYRKRASLEWP